MKKKILKKLMVIDFLLMLLSICLFVKTGVYQLIFFFLIFMFILAVLLLLMIIVLLKEIKLNEIILWRK